MVACSAPGLQDGNRLASCQEPGDPRVHDAAAASGARRRAELRHDPAHREPRDEPPAEEPPRPHEDAGHGRDDVAIAEPSGCDGIRARAGDVMKGVRGGVLLPVTAAVLVAGSFIGCNLEPGERKPRTTLVVGVDTSGSFQRSGYHEDAMKFLAHYIYGHLNNLGGLETPKEMFVAAIGGESANEPKSFHPIQEFAGKEIPEIEHELREWFAPNDAL